MLEKLRIRLAAVDAIPQLALMGILSGLFAGIVIIIFRFVVEGIQSAYLPHGQPENYEELASIYRLVIPTIGGFLIGLWWQWSAPEARIVGIVHVLERLAYHQGYLPLRNAVQQFIGAALCIISGHSVGREGPIVHLGAASGSLLGQWLSLPNNSLRILVACGTAAAIAASFNTPLAGVIFAMEVVMMEYTVVSFTPVILAAVTGAVMTQFIYGTVPAFTVPPLELLSPHLELPYLLLVGLVIGILAALFIQLLKFFTTLWQPPPLWQRTTLAGFLVGCCGLVVPQIMGIGYDTVEAILVGELGLFLMLQIVVLKVVSTTVGIGLGLPGGLIGPTIMIGAAVGGSMGIIAEHWFAVPTSPAALYAMLGMGAMMGATLQAPLAALTALLELTANPNIILPGMLTIIMSHLIASNPPFRQNSVFLELLKARGLDYHNNPVAQSLRRIGVASVMERNFIVLPRYTSWADAHFALRQQPLWVLIKENEQYTYLLLAVDLARFLQETSFRSQFDLVEIPAMRQQVAPIYLQATLQECLEVLNKNQVEALYVVSLSRLLNREAIYGIVTRQDIEINYLVFS